MGMELLGGNIHGKDIFYHVSISYMGMEQEKKINRLTNLDNCINLLYGYGTKDDGYFQIEQMVLYQSPIWVWNSLQVMKWKK